MAYQALYRTYRPKSFAEVVGQKPIVKTLQNALKDGKISHAYLFCGPRGTGKTTMARLFAKALNCSEGVGQECNKCENCLDILEGKHPDVFEIDAASNSGVDNVRKLIEQVSFAPIMGRYKVYIIDEVHSMTGAAFNALLKTLEEPPSHVVFILATTEPDKILPTILSRVQRFDFSKVSDADIMQNMKNILDKEGVTYEDRALDIITRLSNGGVRDSLSLLDQAISYSGKKITENDINSLFGLLSVSDELEIIKRIHLKDTKGTISLINEKYAAGADIIRLHEDLENIYKDLLIFGTTREPSLLSYLKSDEALNTLVTPSEMRRNLFVLIKSRRDYKTSLDAYDHFVLTVLSMITAFEEAPAVPVSVGTPSKEASSSVSANQPVNNPSEAMKQTPPAAPSEVKITDVVKPIEEKPQTIRTYAIDGDDSIDEKSDDFFELSQDEAINIMNQGNKALKNEIISNWKDKLSSVSPLDKFSALASDLTNCNPCIATKECLVVVSFFKNKIKNINMYSSISTGRELMKKLFGHDMRIVALFNSNYIDYVQAFKNMMQANALPPLRPIVLPDKPTEEKKEEVKQTNAQSFMDSLDK